MTDINDLGRSAEADGLSGFAPSPAVSAVPASIPSALGRAEAWHLHLYKMLERERERRRAVEDAFDLLAPFVAKFAAAAAAYDGGQPRYPGSSVFFHDPEPGYRPALASSALIPGAPRDGPTLTDLRMLADAYASAIEARSGKTGTGLTEGESAVP